ncbi:MAG: ribonuclease R, partial [Campylobacteraceae bacterium]|nr:ribonuclease R [Campylobacteraceae bacterium]
MLVQTLFKARALELKRGLYFLSPNFFVGRMDVSSRGTGFLEVFDPSYKSKDILIEQSDLNGASRGDFVLVKR